MADPRMAGTGDAQARAAPIVCDVGGLEADAVTVDALARLQLVARRAGRDVRLRHASDELRELIGLMGLRDVLREEA